MIRPDHRLLNAAVAVVLLTVCFLSSVHAVSAAPLDHASVVADVTLAREAYERVHPGYTRYTDNAVLTAGWQAIIDKSAQRGGLSVEQLYLDVQAVLAKIRCDHTKAELPSSLAKPRRNGPFYLPLRFELVDGRALVHDAVPDNGVAAGDELLAIDGQSIASLINRWAPLIPVDAYTDHVRAGELAWSREFDGGAIEHFMALEGVDPEATLTLKDAQGQTRTVTVARIGLTEQSQLAGSGARNFADAVSLDLRDDQTAILRVDTFVNYRQPVDPDDLYAPLFKQIERAGVRHLIVDLRQNGGGSDDARNRLLAHLITEPTRMTEEIRVKTLDLDGLRPHLSSWEPKALNPSRWWFKQRDEGDYRIRGGLVSWLFGIRHVVKPARYAWSGRLTVLTSPANSSGSTMLLAALKGSGRARFVGGRSGGNVAGPTAGIQFTLTLPNSQIRTRLPVQRIVTGYSSTSPTGSIEPDILVQPSIEDRRAGRDVVLDAALGIVAR
ncbi:MAG: S41 family peptidase [Pseudomonadota bacterium]